MRMPSREAERAPPDRRPAPDPALAALCAGCGVATEFWDWRGRHSFVPRETLIAVLAALGVDASDPAAALAERRQARLQRPLPPVMVVRAGAGSRFAAHLRYDSQPDVLVELEDGGVRADVAPVAGYAVEPDLHSGDRLTAERTYLLPPDLPLGWHRIHITGRGARGRTPEASCPLVVVPQRLEPPPALAGGRAWGPAVQLYAVRSRRSWGHGDLVDLAELAGWSARSLGAGFVTVNPLHAAEPVPPVEPSPYLPTSRRYGSPLYLRIEAIPEYAYLEPSASVQVDRLAAAVGSSMDGADRIDRDSVWLAKKAALELVYEVPRGPGREAAYQSFLGAAGDSLVDFATWCALVEVHGPRWRSWPVELQDPRHAAVTAARRELASRVDFYRWLQWLLDEQRAVSQQAATEAGMRLGIVHDLAVGVHNEGADAWALRDVFAREMSVGAPPDEFNPRGQIWSQPPWQPFRLAAAGFLPYRDVLRAVLRHAGGVRADHVMGLSRLWWVPEGRPADEGTYVRYDHEAMVGILALEADRAGALVIGEDLGTVEPWVRDYLRDRGILGTSVLWFERDQAGPVPPQQWRPLCLATVDTHDLPPIGSFLAGDHLRLADRLGLLTRSYDQVAGEHAEAVEQWLDLLRRLRLLRPVAAELEIVVALHRLLARTPAMLVGVSLADAVGDRRPANVPGTTNEYPNWRLPLADAAGKPVLLEDLTAAPELRELGRVLTVAIGGP
jgi:4-alpha-glucanotransferase